MFIKASFTTNPHLHSQLIPCSSKTTRLKYSSSVPAAHVADLSILLKNLKSINTLNMA